MHRRNFLQMSMATLAGAQTPARRYRVALVGDTGHGNYGHDWDLAWTSFPNVEVVFPIDKADSFDLSAARRHRAARVSERTAEVQNCRGVQRNRP
jgi:hypothetical protein